VRSPHREVRLVQLEADDVLRNIRTGVITVDADGRLLYANPARKTSWDSRPASAGALRDAGVCAPAEFWLP